PDDPGRAGRYILSISQRLAIQKCPKNPSFKIETDPKTSRPSLSQTKILCKLNTNTFKFVRRERARSPRERVAGCRGRGAARSPLARVRRRRMRVSDGRPEVRPAAMAW